MQEGLAASPSRGVFLFCSTPHRVSLLSLSLSINLFRFANTKLCICARIITNVVEAHVDRKGCHPLCVRARSCLTCLLYCYL